MFENEHSVFENKRNMKRYDFLVIGAGIFGITTAIELRKRGHTVGVLNPDTIPHPLAASTDISKVVRMEYGADQEYMDMVEDCIGGWHAWNEQFGDRLYHEVGFLMLCRQPVSAGLNDFETASYKNLPKATHINGRPGIAGGSWAPIRNRWKRRDLKSNNTYTGRVSFRCLTHSSFFTKMMGIKSSVGSPIR